MAVDYKRLADDDPGGDLFAAFATMNVLDNDTTKAHKVTYVSIADGLTVATSKALEARVSAAATADVLPQWFDNALRREGIDINRSHFASRLDSLVGGAFTKAMAGAIKAMGVRKVMRYAGFKPGHLQNARQKRARRDV